MPQNRISKTALHWTPPGKRKRGRPRTTWRRTITSELEEMGYSWGQAQFIANDRARWRQLVEALSPTGDEEDNCATSQIPAIPGECQNIAGNVSVYRYEVLPGSGWDNLKNENKGRVVQYSYTLCQITDDGTFLVPDGVVVLPVKSSRVDRFADFVDHFSNATSDLAASINLDASVTVENIPINGKFSFDFQKMKQNLINDNSTALKTKAHYVQYTAKLQPGLSLDATFKKRIQKIAHNILNNKTSSARYESQLLVRDFGTHVITSVDAGASIVKIDHVTRSLFETVGLNKYQISAAAAAEVFGVQVGVTIPIDTMNSYLAAKTHSSITTNGGPVYKPINFTINDWIDQIDQNLVSVDRSGDPLHFIINENNFPELSVSLIEDTATEVEKAINAYYKLNSHRGCTDRDSPNFNFYANIEDGSCRSDINNTNFGGVFQICNTSGDINGICDEFLKKNPKTGDFSCPEGFTPVPLFTGSRTKRAVTQSCSSYWIFWHHCETTNYFGVASYQSFWCAAQEPSNSNGYIFGGLYTSHYPNVQTQQQSCPQFFTSLSLADDIRVCISDDYENGYSNSIPFNGFFSCQYPNPLATNQNGSNCRAGFSQHLAAIVDDCEINYCARFRTRDVSFVPIRSPPFSKRPSDDNDSSVFVVSDDGFSWTQIYAVPENFAGFNGTNSSWIINSGSFLDNHDLLMARQQEYNNDNPYGNPNFLGSQEQSQRQQNLDEGTERIPIEQVVGVVGGSVGITLSFVLFVGVLVYVFSRSKKTKKVSDGYTKMKA